jgi:hypothetical protein
MNTLNNIPSGLKENFWLVSAEMGYGHQRAIYPLLPLARFEEILTANSSPYSTAKERRLWKRFLYLYEFLSRAGKVPIIRSFLSGFLDSMLHIPKFYPVKDRSKPTLQVRYIKLSIKKGLCKGIVDEVSNTNIPVITSFYAPALACEMADIKNVFCIICDTDLSRAWVSEDPLKSDIRYFATCSESAQRLLSYGVPEKNVFLTGFPLPLELLGNRHLNILKHNLARRLTLLDPDNKFRNLYKRSVSAFINEEEVSIAGRDNGTTKLTITYVVGGAGAQVETGGKIAHSLKSPINRNQVKLYLVAGTRKEVREYFIKVKEDVAPDNDNIQVIWAEDFKTYYDIFNKCLQTTDILWTKPSELSFYCALGIPIIMTPAIGPQEKFNRRWLRETGAGFKQKNPEFTDQWLFDLLHKGRLAEAAWLGFLKARKYGTYNILDFFEKGEFTSSNNPLKR